MRSLLRRLLASALGLVPLGWLSWTRHAYARAGAGSATRAVLRPVLEVLRHRSLVPLETFALAGTPRLEFLAGDSIVMRRLYWFGEEGYEGSEARWWRECCARAKGVLEIGANVGYYTVQGASAAPGVPYTAVEPHPQLAEQLREHVRLNGCADVRVVEAAVVGIADADVMELSLPDVDHYALPTGAYLSRGAEGIDRPAGRSVTVEVVEVDDLMAGVDLVKLDAEGYEQDILAAALPRLRSQRPTVFVELRGSAHRLRELVVQLCHDDGYTPLAIGTRELEVVDPDELRGLSLLSRYPTRDVVLVPDERRADLVPR